MSALASAVRLTAGEWLAIVRDPTRDKRYLAAQLGGDVTAYLSWAATEARKRPRTLDQYERDLARLCVLYPALARNDFTRDELRAWIASYPEGSRPRVWAAGSSFWRWQYDEERVARNPMRGIRRPKSSPRRVIDVFTPVERSRLVTAAYESLLPERDRVGQLLLHETGARKSDARRLRVRDVNLADRYVIFRDGKGGDDRIVPFGEELQRALFDFLHTRIGPIYPYTREHAREEGIRHVAVWRLPGPADHVLFPAIERNGEVAACWPDRPMAPSTFHRWWQRCIDRAGIDYRKPHTTRHTYGTDLLDANVDLVTVAEALGHKSLDTTRTYVHNQRGRLRKAADALELARRHEGD